MIEIVSRINRFIEQNNMLNNCDNIVAGLSGGADSVWLLYVLKTYIESRGLNIRLKAVHINHGIREEAWRDEKVAHDFCDKYGIDYECFKVDVKAVAAKLNMTLEEAGRKERYRIFNELADKLSNCRIAVAHHMNDQAETVIMNLSRGSGIKGLGGMMPVRDNIIRPLLCITRQEVELCLSQISQEFAVDATNSDNTYTRNVCRNIIIPKLEESVNCNVVENISKAATEIREAYCFIDKYANVLFSSTVTMDENSATIHLKSGEFQAADSILRRSVIYKILVRLSGQAKDVYRTHVAMAESLLDMQVGSEATLCFGLMARRDYESVFVWDSKKIFSEIPDNVSNFYELDKEELEKNGQVDFLPEWDIFCEEDSVKRIKNLRFEIIENNKAFLNIQNTDYDKFFDYDKIIGNIQIRFRREGDRITVNSNSGSKKLKKELIDRKIPERLRDNILLISRDDEILWAVGVRRCEDYYVDEDTTRILRISIET